MGARFLSTCLRLTFRLQQPFAHLRLYAIGSLTLHRRWFGPWIGLEDNGLARGVPPPSQGMVRLWTGTEESVSDEARRLERWPATAPVAPSSSASTRALSALGD